MNGLPRSLLLLPAILIFAAAAESLYLQSARQHTYDWRSYLASLGEAFGRVFINRTVGFVIAGSVFALASRMRIATIPMNHWYSWLALLFALEFFYYWMHRADHRLHRLWVTNAVHHAINANKLSAAYRLGWTSELSGRALFFAPLVFAGFSAKAVLGVASLNLCYQFWLHTGLMPRLGPFERILNTPRHHGVHRARNPEYVDKNFGGVLIVFDRMFGTLASDVANLPPEYGLVHRVRA